MAQNLLKDYVPRHLRLGVSCGLPKVDLFQEVREEIPILDDNGNCVRLESVLVSRPANEVMQQYKLEQFKLSHMVAAGVPLKMVNINSSSSVTIDKLEKIAQDLDAADKYVKKLEEQRKERESWFKFDDVDVPQEEKIDLNEIY